MENTKIDVTEKLYSKQEVNAMMFEKFAKLGKQPLVDLTKTTTSSLSFQRFSKEKIIEFLKNPATTTNIKNIRDASIYMYNNSSHYRRLISYYSLMPSWAYIISPAKFDPTKAKDDAFKKQYIKVAQVVENMQLKHELQKATTVAFREDVFYGVCWETTDSFFIQRINADYCELSSIEDGVYNFAVDMSKIKEADLGLYPPEFTTMYNTYKTSKQKKQEVPSKISACFKVNEDLPYPLPIFAGTMVSLHDIEDYKSLLKQRTEVGNYKAVNMQIPLDNEGSPLLDWNKALSYYEQMLNVLPEYIGATISPMKVDTFDFEKSGGLSETDEVFKAEEQFWNSTGTSSLLFGGGSKGSVSSLGLSIKSDIELVVGFMNQVERWLNRRLKNISGSIDLKVNILPVTMYNQGEMAELYKNGGTYGLPCKSAYCATLNMTPLDIAGMNYLENTILDFPNEFIPLSSSHTQSGDTGRPTNASQGKTLTESGQQSQENK